MTDATERQETITVAVPLTFRKRGGRRAIVTFVRGPAHHRCRRHTPKPPSSRTRCSGEIGAKSGGLGFDPPAPVRLSNRSARDCRPLSRE